MFSQTVEFYETPEQKDRLIKALNCVCTARPHLSGLAVLMKIHVCDAVKTAGITPSGRLIINPQFMAKLNLQNLAFILAHEIMHLVLKTHERADNYDNRELVNIAHDFIINNDLASDFTSFNDYDFFWLSRHSKHDPPAGGLNWEDYRKEIPNWKPANEYSLEEMVSVLKRENIFPQQSWAPPNKPNTSRQPASSRSGGGSSGISYEDFLGNQDLAPQEKPPQADPERPFPEPQLDLLSEEDERRIFPQLTQEEVERSQKEIHEATIRSYSEAALVKTLKNYEQSLTRDSNAHESMIEMLRRSYATPWEAALQRWFDTVTPGNRSFAKASRRGAWRTDVVLPGRKREGWTLHIVLDTSGSMSDSLRHALGAIDNFCQNNNVETVHILQCDTGITSDEWVEVGELEKFQAKGFGGSDMTPAMLRLAEDPYVTAVLVLTDGYIRYPEKEPPYETLWGIVDHGITNFRYGIAIPIEAPEKQPANT